MALRRRDVPESAATALVEAVVAAAHDTNRFGSETVADAIARYAFAPACARALVEYVPKLAATLVALAHGMLDVAEAKRPHVARSLAVTFAAACRTAAGDQSDAAAAFASVLTRLLLHREPEEREWEREVGNPPVSRTRLCALFLLENEDAMPSSLRRTVCRELLAIEATLREATAATAQRSGAWGRRLRLWQALCVLAPTAPTAVLDDVVAFVPKALVSPCHPAVRYAIETASVAFTRRWPHQLLPVLLDAIGHVRDQDASRAGEAGRELALASLLVAAGSTVAPGPQPAVASEAFAPRLLRVALALQGSTRGLVRGVAQLLVLALADVVDLTGDNRAYVRDTIAALRRDPDVIRNLKRQRHFFWSLRSPGLCTVQGLLNQAENVDGDIVTESVVVVFRTQIQEAARQIAQDDDPALWASFRGTVAEPPSEDPLKKTPTFIQRKILVDQQAPSATKNLAGNTRMRVIVCASLVDKVPNLGGLVRTAEVFAAEALVVPDLRLTKSVAFQAVAVTADRWVRIDECHPSRLLDWLRAKRRDGYSIVALEQATGSVSLADVTLPTPAVLLLGHEKEGLDLTLLQVVDLCVEVPQLGIVRSLNVHVSGALALWHWAKQHLRGLQ